MDTLRAIFRAGPGAGLSAQEVFTNRVEEINAFRDAVGAMLSAARDGSAAPTTNPTEPRSNVLVYYGVGGVGKTGLSRRLERLFHAGELDLPLPSKRAVVRIDFGETGALDVEAVLLKIRAALGTLHDRWPAFDLAFAAYWSRAHPGEPLADFVRNSSSLRRHADRVGLSNQIEESVAAVFQEIGLAWAPATLGLNLIRALQRHVRQSMTFRRLASECPFFTPLLEAEADTGTAAYLASLLAWELERRQRRSEQMLVVFLDTFEAIARHGLREVECYVQRMMFLMPNVLFVVTGRNRLDWAEAQPPSDLDYVGRSRWPLLHRENREHEPRQHLVGALSTQDCDTYLSEVLLSADGQPALEGAVRDRIIQASNGLPLYLDLSVAQFLELVATRRPVTPEAFGGPLAAVVTRMLRDLDPGERTLLRAVSMVDSFDAEMARAIAGPVPDAVVDRFLSLTFVERAVGLPWPYALHRLLRETIRDTDRDVGDPWSEREWRDAAERGCRHLEGLAREHMRRRNRSGVADCFVQAARVAAGFGLCPDWLVDAGQFLADSGSWNALSVRTATAPDVDTPIGALLAALNAITMRRSGSLDESVRALSTARSCPGLTAAARDFVDLHRAHSMRNAGQYAAAEAEYRQLESHSPAYGERARIQLADIALLRGRFEAAIDSLSAATRNPDVRGEQLRIVGHTWRFNARFEAAEVQYVRAQRLAEETSSVGLEGKVLTNLAETAAWVRPDEAAVLAERAVKLNEALGNRLEVLKACSALAVSTAGRDPRTVDAALARALDLVGSSAYRAGAAFAEVARTFDLLLRGRVGEARTAYDTLLEVTRQVGVYGFLAEIAAWWLDAHGVEVDPPRDRAVWIDGPDAARRRWLDVLEARQEGAR